MSQSVTNAVAPNLVYLFENVQPFKEKIPELIVEGVNPNFAALHI